MSARDSNARREAVAWVVREILPKEAGVRRWLSRALVAQEDIDDIVQDAYCRIATMESVTHIDRPGAFFFQTVRNLLFNRLKRAKLVRIETGFELDLFVDTDAPPSQEKVLEHRQEWNRVSTLIAALPERTRRIFEMRKIEGLPQREIAERLGLSENVVENEAANGLRLLMAALRQQGPDVAEYYERKRMRRSPRA